MEVAVWIFFTLLLVVIWGRIVIRIIRERFASPKRVTAMVKDKSEFTETTVRKQLPMQQNRVYTVTFLIGAKTRVFRVRKETYLRIAVGESGTLVHCGSRFLDFTAKR